MAAWLFGSEGPVDLSSAERAIEQLSKDRDAVADRVTQLQEIASQQKARINELKKAKQQAQLEVQRAKEAIEKADHVMNEKSFDTEATRRRFAKACAVFNFQEEADRIISSIHKARDHLFPSPVVVAGPNGVGKATLIAKLVREYGPNVALPISHTSRAPEPGEKHGVHYYFSAKEEMEQAAKEGKFLEMAEVEGDLYGTSAQSVISERSAGKVVLVHIDLAGAQQVKGSGIPTVVVWVEPPSLQALEPRLKARGVHDEEITLRMNQAEAELQEARRLGGELFDYIICNDDLDQAYVALKEIVKATANWMSEENEPLPRRLANQPKSVQPTVNARPVGSGSQDAESASEGASLIGASEDTQKILKLPLEEILANPKLHHKLRDVMTDLGAFGGSLPRLTGNEGVVKDDN